MIKCEKQREKNHKGKQRKIKRGKGNRNNNESQKSRPNKAKKIDEGLKKILHEIRVGTGKTREK